jgi:hypothetical protein
MQRKNSVKIVSKLKSCGEHLRKISVAIEDLEQVMLLEYKEGCEKDPEFQRKYEYAWSQKAEINGQPVFQADSYIEPFYEQNVDITEPPVLSDINIFVLVDQKEFDLSSLEIKLQLALLSAIADSLHKAKCPVEMVPDASGAYVYKFKEN